MPKALIPSALLCAALTLTGSASAASLTVFAASSLTDAFTEVGRAFDTASGNRTTFQFAGSQSLRTQLENGARADIYASANDAQYTPLVQKGLLAAGQTFARNRLTVIVPTTNKSIRTLADLGKPGVRLVIADRAVPVGDYTRRMLSAIDAAGTYGRDFSARALKNVVSEEANVRQLALKVQLGEADAAVVYASDVTPTLKSAVRVVALPTRFNQNASYPLGILTASQNRATARAFVAYVQSAAGQNILKQWGFLGAR